MSIKLPPAENENSHNGNELQSAGRPVLLPNLYNSYV